MCIRDRGSLCAFSGALCGLLMIGKGLNTWLVLMIVFGVAILIGVWNGGSIAVSYTHLGKHRRCDAGPGGAENSGN